MADRTDKELQQAIMDADTPREFVNAMHTFYRRQDRADVVSRELLYLHLGMATGMIMRILDRREAAPEDRVPQ